MRPVTLLLALVLLVPSALAAPAGHVGLCHRIQGGSGSHYIEVDPSAVPAHLAHGDTLASGGTCPGGPAFVQCGGFAGFPCPPGSTCIDAPDDGCDPFCGGADCGGICVTFPALPCERGECPPGFACIDDPRDDCDPECGDANCPAVCAQETGVTCGTIAGLACPEGTECAEVVGDGCNADCGGADCVGRCVVLARIPCDGGRHDCPADSICVDDPSDTCGSDCDPSCPRICATPLR